MAKYISNRNTISAQALKRRAHGAVIVRHYGRVDIRFTRVTGGWMRDTDVAIVSSVDVATECNKALGCKESWAKVY